MALADTNKKKLEAFQNDVKTKLEKLKDTAKTVENKNNGAGNYSNSGGGSGGSGGGGKNSQYTGYNSKYTGSQYQNIRNQAANTDGGYMQIMNDARGRGDYMTAAYAEQLRNEYINNTGSNYDTTRDYAGWLDKTDLGTLGINGIETNAPAHIVRDYAVNRYNKAKNTTGMEGFADDDIQKQLWDYINAHQSEVWGNNYSEANPTPEYESRYAGNINSLLKDILNRDDFSYDAESDPLYQQYAKMYAREGDRAMKETMAEAAAGAGGMNSYAVTAAQQAANNYSAQLNNMIPQLYQLAYDMYLNDKESQVQNLGLLQNADAMQYSRYRDTMDDFRNDRNFAYGLYRDDLAQNNWQQSFDNSNYWANKEFDYNSEWANKNYEQNIRQYDQEQARTLIQWIIESGEGTPSPELIAKAGMTQEEVDSIKAGIKNQIARGVR